MVNVALLKSNILSPAWKGFIRCFSVAMLKCHDKEQLKEESLFLHTVPDGGMAWQQVARAGSWLITFCWHGSGARLQILKAFPNDILPAAILLALKIL